MPFLCNNKTKYLKEKNLQLQKKLQILWAEKEAMQLSMEELQKKLELAEARLLQSSSQMQQILAQIHILQEDKQCSVQEVRQLKTTLEELRRQLEGLLPPQSPVGPTEAEQ
jgi:predicted nuclease with TOPRIM domain